MPRNYYVSGGWNVICDSCGKKIKASEAKQRWDGLIVCPADFEMRQPQDFVKARQDKITVPFTRPRPTDVFILTQGINDPITFSDSITTHAHYTRLINDSLAINDNIVKHYPRSFNDIVYMQDSGLEDYVQLTYFLSDYMEAGGGFSIFVGKTQTEAITIVENLSKSLQLSESDSASLLEFVMEAYNKQTSETITISDLVNVVRNINTPATESLSVSDTNTNVLEFIRAFEETLTVDDLISIYKNTFATLSDEFTTSDDSSSIVSYIRTIADSISLADSSTFTTNTQLTDTTTVADSGNVWYNNYIDPTYFASDYVGTYTNF